MIGRTGPCSRAAFLFAHRRLSHTTMALTAEQLETLATAALSLRTAGGERQARSASDIIQLLEYASGQTANASRTSPIRLQKLRFGGAVVTGGCE